MLHAKAMVTTVKKVTSKKDFKNHRHREPSSSRHLATRVAPIPPLTREVSSSVILDWWCVGVGGGQRCEWIHDKLLLDAPWMLWEDPNALERHTPHDSTKNTIACVSAVSWSVSSSTRFLNLRSVSKLSLAHEVTLFFQHWFQFSIDSSIRSVPRTKQSRKTWFWNKCFLYHSCFRYQRCHDFDYV